MTTRQLIVLVLFCAACGRAPGVPLVVPEIVLPAGSTRASPASAALIPLGYPAGFNPLSLKAAVVVNARAAVAETVKLPVPFSAQSAFVAVRAKADTTVTLAGQSLSLRGGGSDGWALVPLQRGGALTLTSSVETELSVRPAGDFDESGAGLSFVAEPAVEQSLAARTPVQLRLFDPMAAEPDDTWGIWLDATVTALATEVWVELRGCGAVDPLEQLTVPAGETRRVRLLAPRATLCAFASEAATVRLQPLARFRRFTPGSFQPVQPLTVLDTAAGIGWKGSPLTGQMLEVDLSQVQGLAGATGALFKVSAQRAGRCGAELGELDESGLQLHELGGPLCVLGGTELKVELLGIATPADPEPSSCPALPLAGPCSATDLLGTLNCIPGVSATAASGPDQYLLEVTQPADHARPDGETFTQRVLLTYVRRDAPVVLHTTGYELFSYRSDLGRHLQANELEVEHRFFEASTPASRDWSQMDIVQSAHDSHRLVELLRPVLGGAWLGTGHSKGGMTTLFHRRFFPCDVDGSVPYVAPLSYGMADPRYGRFLQDVGGQTYQQCRQVFRDIDRGIIARRAQLAARLRGTYDKLGGAENALWEITGMMSWSLFQYEDADDPDQGCPAYVALAQSPQFSQVPDYYSQYAEGYSDQSLAQGPNETTFGYTYQVTNELGSQGASREHLADLAAVPRLPAVEPLSLGSVVAPRFEPRSMLDVQRWLSTHGARFLFIYGELDPWSAGQLDIIGTRDALKLVAPRLNHGAGLDDLTASDHSLADAALQRWLGSSGPRPKSLRRSALDAQPQFREVMKRLKL